MTEIVDNTISNKSAQVGRNISLEPQTITERKLAQVWSEILNVSDVTVNSDFFDLGGNSLTVIRLLTRVQDVFGEDVLSPDAAFENGQLAKMAASIDAGLGIK